MTPATPPLPPAASGEDPIVTASEIEQALGQTLQRALNLDDWERDGGLEHLLVRAQEAITTSVREEDRLCRAIRQQVLARLGTLCDAPDQAGVYRATDHQLRAARRNIHLRGGTTAVEGAGIGHDGLAATLFSLGVSLVRYDSDLHSWRTTFLRQDYRVRTGDPIEELRGVLDRRDRRSGPGLAVGSGRDRISTLLRRAFLAAAERKALLEQTACRWRIGHGVPAPLELLSGSGCMELIDEILPVLEALLLAQTRWVFIPSTLQNRALATLAHALEPGQIALFQKGKPMLEAMVDRGTYALGYKRKVQRFAAQAGEAFVVGGFRASPYAPAQLFVAHAEHALEAGLIALADAELQPFTGYPLLLDIARQTARFGLGVEAFRGVVETAYARARAPGLLTAGRLVMPE